MTRRQILQRFTAGVLVPMPGLVALRLDVSGQKRHLRALCDQLDRDFLTAKLNRLDDYIRMRQYAADRLREIENL